MGDPHTVPAKVTGKCGSVLTRLVPAPRGTGIVAAPVPKKLLQLAGVVDCYTSARGMPYRHSGEMRLVIEWKRMLIHTIMLDDEL